MIQPPSGTVTFLFSDIEGSTRLWERFPTAMKAALADHDERMREVVVRHDGYLVKTTGDGILAAFERASDAAGASVAIQQVLQTENWDEVGPLRVRIALHTGSAQFREGDYFGPAVNRTARLMSIGHGGQILASVSTRDLLTDDLLTDDLPADTSLRDLGDHQLKDLTRPEHVFQLIHPDVDEDFPPLKSLDRLPHNLPRQLTSFIGRETEIEQVKSLLSGTALLTLTGIGGSGKTRLALQAAAELVDAYPDGVWLVELGQLSDPDRIPQAVAEVLGVHEPPNRSLVEALIHHLDGKELLLVLDNCEHLLRACGELVERLLRSCHGLQILTTSREGLGIWGEQTLTVPSLSVPDVHPLPPLETLAEYATVRLFVERGVAALPDFRLTDANAPTVASICERLDGIPLAIELAAARVRALPVDEIAQRLEDRFRLLTGGSRTALPRHQTLQATMDWSYELLSPEEKRLLQRLSVFTGGFTLEAAERVCPGRGIDSSDVLDLLTSLVEKSIVSFTGDRERRRYRLLETVRQYARQRLYEAGGVTELRDSHLEYFLALADRVRPHLGFFLPREETTSWLERLAPEYDNFRAALSWSLEHGDRVDLGVELAHALHWFWYARGYFKQERELLQRLLNEVDGIPTAVRAQGLVTEGYLACWQGDFPTAASPLSEALDLFRAMDDRAGATFALHGLGYVDLGRGDLTSAHSKFKAAAEEAQTLEDKWLISFTLHFLGQVEAHRGDRNQASALIHDGLAALRQAGGNIQGEAFSLFHLGHIAQLNGDVEDAQDHYRKSLQLFNQLATTRGRDLVYPLEGLAAVAALRGNAWRATTLYGAAEARREALDFDLESPLQAERGHYVSDVIAKLGEAASAKAWEQGRRMTLEQAVDFALTQSVDDAPSD